MQTLTWTFSSMSLFPLLLNASDSLLHHTVGDGTPLTSQVMSMVNPEYVVYVLGRPTTCAGTETKIIHDVY